MVNSPKDHHFLLVSAFYPPHVGGVESYTYHLAHNLKKRGFSVTVLTSGNRNSKVYDDNGVRVVYIKSAILFHERLPIPYALTQIYHIYREYIKRNNPTVVISTRLYPLSVITAILSKVTGITPILIEHGSGVLPYPSRITTALFHWYEHVLTWLIKLSKPHFYGVSTACNTWLGHFGIHAKGVISNGIDLDNCNNQNKIKRGKIFIYAGRLIKEKGVLELIEGFTIFHMQFPEYSLVIAGSGDLGNYVQMKADENPCISFLGRKTRQEIQQLLQQADGFIHPSYYPEGLPTIILEAGLEETPVLATAAGGVSDVIRHKETGLILSDSTPECITQTLTYAATHHDEMRQYASALNRLVKKEYDWSVITNSMLKELNIYA